MISIAPYCSVTVLIRFLAISVSELLDQVPKKGLAKKKIITSQHVKYRSRKCSVIYRSYSAQIFTVLTFFVQARIYESIIDDVINDSRQDFEDSGIDEATLQDLRTVCLRNDVL